MSLFRASKYSLCCNLSLSYRHIEDDGEGNVHCYNDEIDTFPEEKKGWAHVNWLFAECYV